MPDAPCASRRSVPVWRRCASAAAARGAGAGRGAGRSQRRPRRIRRTVCGSPMPRPRAAAGRLGPGRLPRSRPCFEAQGNVSVIEPQTYLYYIQLKPSRPSRGRLGAVRRGDREDRSATTSTGCGTPTSSTTSGSKSPTTRSRTASIGKLVTYNMEERQRVKIVDYIGSKKVEIDEDRREAEGSQRRRSASTPSSIPAWSGRSKASSATC